MKRAITYQANDGTQFVTVEECKRHEEKLIITNLCRLDETNILSALDRTDLILADAFERVGHLIAEKRRAMGGAKRKRKTIAEKPFCPNETAGWDASTITAKQEQNDKAMPAKKAKGGK